jgi:hypothetical protein
VISPWFDLFVPPKLIFYTLFSRFTVNLTIHFLPRADPGCPSPRPPPLPLRSFNFVSNIRYEFNYFYYFPFPSPHSPGRVLLVVAVSTTVFFCNFVFDYSNYAYFHWLPRC